MELKKVLNGLEDLKASGNLDIEINNIQMDSKKIETGDIFIAIKGFNLNGNDFIESAIENGAKAIVLEENFDFRSIKNIENVTIITTKNTRHAFAIICCNFYNNPSKNFKLIGVTGTKGKTTTTFMMKKILEAQGKKVALIGTIANYIGDKCLGDSERTTPESLELQQIFAECVKENIDVVIMEVSSQSLKLDRVSGCNFDVGVFTNFSKDHISEKEHPDMEDYFNSKLKLFDMCKTAFVNVDDIYGNKIKKLKPNCEITTYGIDNSCDLLAKDITITSSSVDFKIKIDAKNERIKTNIPGRFTVYNAIAAIAVTNKLGCSAETIKNAMLEIKVPGRSELIPNKKNLVIMRDYAHSPESLDSILKALKLYIKGKIICVFGCGGDRDTSKRQIMGEISGKISDFSIITSDNPRTEEPEKIVNEIEIGMKRTNGKYICIVDRKQAIEYAIKIANKSDVIILAGKGHEPYQEINGNKYPFNEIDIVNEIIK